MFKLVIRELFVRMRYQVDNNNVYYHGRQVTKYNMCTSLSSGGIALSSQTFCAGDYKVCHQGASHSLVSLLTLYFTFRYVFRLYWLPLKVLHSTGYGSMVHHQTIKLLPFYYFFNGMLWTLQLMNIYWFMVSEYLSSCFHLHPILNQISCYCVVL